MDFAWQVLSNHRGLIQPHILTTTRLFDYHPFFLSWSASCRSWRPREFKQAGRSLARAIANRFHTPHPVQALRSQGHLLVSVCDDRWCVILCYLEQRSVLAIDRDKRMGEPIFFLMFKLADDSTTW